MPSAEKAEAQMQVQRAWDELESSGSSCTTACRALGSLERATARLCDLAEADEDKQRCEDAKKKLRSARDRVRAACTTCPGGPSVDRDAPISPP
jgi:hypothetical protein